MEDVHRTVHVPANAHWTRRLFAFIGPAYMVSVGYMDPGNWATDLAGGAKFGYSLIWVLLLSNLMAILLQTLSVRLGLASGRDLAQACRDAYGPVVRWILFILCEIAIAACDLAEVLGTAIGLNLLTSQLPGFGGHGIPLIWAVVITGLDVFLLLAIQKFGIRKMEALIISLVSMIGLCFIVEFFLAKPEVTGIARGFIPGLQILHDHEMLFIAIGIIGATVMPHNLYLHSALVQSRNVDRTPAGFRQAMKYNTIDSVVALNCAFFVNAAILIVAAAVFFRAGRSDVAELQDAHRLLEGLLGSKVAPIAFALALLFAGQSSTITGTLAGQITMEGFLHFRIQPWLRRLITRSMAIIPAVIVIAISGEDGTGKLLILSQVILSLQLPFAIVPLVKFTASRAKLGEHAIKTRTAIIAWIVAAIILLLNAKLVFDQINKWGKAAGEYRFAVIVPLGALSIALVALLLWMIFRREEDCSHAAITSPHLADQIIAEVIGTQRRVQRIGVALGAEAADAPMLREAIILARTHGARLTLLHIVDSAGAQYHGPHADDAERRSDEIYVEELVEKLRIDERSKDLQFDCALGYGDVRRELVRLSKELQLDILVLGGHGHRALADLIRGTTINAVRHRLKIPILAVR